MSKHRMPKYGDGTPKKRRNNSMQDIIIVIISSYQFQSVYLMRIKKNC